MRIAVLLLFFFAHLANADIIDLSFGPVRVGEPRIDINLDHFKLRYEKIDGVKIKAGLLKDSVQWIRLNNNLLIPRARLAIALKTKNSNVHFLYEGQAFVPEKRNGYQYIELFIHLFTTLPIDIYDQGQKIGKITIETDIPKDVKNLKQIDYSCSSFGLNLEGLEQEYVSLGCHLERKGDWGKEKPRLEVTWAPTNYTLLDGTNPPFINVINGQYHSEVFLKNQKGEVKKVSIKTNLPNRLHRVKTAYGFGPYMFKTQRKEQTIENEIAPALFLYGKIDLTTSSSFRFFNALIFRESIFNNFGLYFAYDLARLFDGKINIIPLLGTQTLSFQYDSADELYTQIIYPQGFEVVFNHFLDIENYTVVYGMFLSTESKVEYQNAWIRWGKGMFWELNYINWAYGDRKATMYGLSVGLPLVSFF
jgi:hypothetical protein